MLLAADAELQSAAASSNNALMRRQEREDELVDGIIIMVVWNMKMDDRADDFV